MNRQEEEQGVTVRSARRRPKGETAIEKLSPVFRKYGYDAASLTMLQDATGMSKGSLYHRFPEGKVQMVQEVIESRGRWLSEHVFTPLRDDRPPAVRIREMLRFVDKHYDSGISVCLLGVLAMSESSKQYCDNLTSVFLDWIDALSIPLVDAGMRKPEALKLSQMSIMKIQGALLLTRALGTNRPFKEALASIRAELLAAIAEPDAKRQGRLR